MEKDYSTRQGKKEVNKYRKRLFFRVGIVLSLLILVTGLVSSIQLYGLVQSAPDIDEETFHFAESSTLYDENDEIIMTLSNGEDRQSIKVEDIPQHVQDAFIAIEDIRFREHSGLDLKRIGGAVLSNITNGFGSEGGSTITQQVVKNTLLTSEKSIGRKVKEVYLALEVEKEYTKDEILEFYLNKIYFGNGAYGIVNATNTYFDKGVEELTLEEAAFLAGLPRRPSSYDPYQNADLAEERRNIVLGVMNEHDFITDEEFEKAKSVAIGKMVQEKKSVEEISDAFMDQVYKELESIEGIDASMIYSGGLEIYTTYDKEAQEHVEKVLNSDEFVSYPDDRFQAGVALIDHRTGEIKAIGGGRNQESGKNRLNYGTNIQRSPGSTIKPILSYGPAIEHFKWSSYQQIEDEEMTYSGSDQVIRNHNDQYHGIISIREALKQSWNIPALKTFKELGRERAKEFASNIGLSIEGSLYESYALGSFTEGISPLELAGAYSAFANEGTYNEPHAIRKVVFPDGKEVTMQPKSVVAMSDYTSYIVTDMLKTVVEEGTGQLANIEGIEVAGKTGTTNFNDETKQKYVISEGVPDVWFAGYTTNYTAAVWTGYRQVNEDNYIKTREDRQIAQHIFREVMSEMIDENTGDFTKPNSVEEITIDTKKGERASGKSNNKDIVTELFVSGTTIKDAYKLVEEEWEKKQSRSNKEEEKEKQTHSRQIERREEDHTPVIESEEDKVEEKEEEDENEKNDAEDVEEESEDKKEDDKDKGKDKEDGDDEDEQIDEEVEVEDKKEEDEEGS
ncbi:transglycosylase domain-containing protein [Halalkalibacter alkalisediminis]|uniref:Transglycosylase domain-containing protein n=1 Tax=Halalkalibacter alkalisediminis TaxID=935616 RepID=A0ABV6NE90_9BACI|nr:PBP1A family penicillin-binding protein [Halalkalibacter alkalisediminis]